MTVTALYLGPHTPRSRLSEVNDMCDRFNYLLIFCYKLLMNIHVLDTFHNNRV